MIVSVLLGIALIVALACAAFCAGAETGFLSVSRGRVLHMAREGGKRAKIVQAAIGDMARTTTTLLVGNNIAAVSFSSASAALAARAFGDSAGLQTVWSVAAAFAMLILGEFLPKLFCAARPLRRTLLLAPVWRVFEKALSPLGRFVTAVIGLVMPRREARPQVTPATVLKILEDRKDGVKLTDFESALIGRIMVLRSKGEFVIPDTVLPALDDIDG